ncbi:flagellar hook-associated protein FlgL [Actinoplanes capillaceus]|uniref:Flagellin n=1 Tax=Actinoplanes campanulatus TaxID=113559 RepID=A0ABQ3W8G0_9ACTN|nr:flagellin [Actinoplanes capillaceus]GID43334.1 flagellar hook-associated protein FlgL [Actinoplanes capillaceus]
MSMSPRVTENSVRTRVMGNLQRSLGRTHTTMEQISSGKQLHRPSDSPTGTVTALQLRGEVRANQKYSLNADDAFGRLGMLQDNLQSMTSLMSRVRELALEGASTGTTSPEANAARAAEIDQIKGTLLQQANSKYLDRPVFGGATVGSEAYDMSGAYVGESTVQTLRAVGPNAKVRVDLGGPEVFGAEGSPTQLFRVLDDLSTAIRASDHTAINAGMKNLDQASDLVKSTLSEVGARYNRVTQMKQSAEDRLMSVSSQLSGIEDIDLPKAIMDLQLQQNSYQAALAATAKVVQPSLIDFLR